MESGHSAPTPTASEPAYSVAVYDAKTGDVLLIHHFGAMPGIELPQSEQLHEIALSHAARRYKRGPESMQVLKVDVSAIERRRTYRVSLPDQVLVAAPARKRRR